MQILLWKRWSSFTYLNISQFLVTLNDSIFRLLVAYSLIDLLGIGASNKILAISGLLFVLPFLVFSMPAGDLADKYSKRNLLVWTLVAEVVGISFGLVALHFRNVTASYLALFCVAVQAAVFNPVKYAILPEIVPAEKISKINGILTLCTYLAIIFGTFLASFITEISGRNYTLVSSMCVIFAVFGVFFGLQIEKTPRQNPDKRINPYFFSETINSFKLASKKPHLLLTIVASSYFLFTAAYTQLNMIPFGVQSLGITDVQTGYVFLVAAIGIGLGSIVVAVLSGTRVELGLCVLGAFGTAFSYILMFFFDTHLLVIVFFIFSLGLNGGIFIVPLDAYIQITSPKKDRGEIVAGSSFLGFVGVLCAAGAIAFLGDFLQLTAAEGFLIIGGLTLLVSIVITILLPDYFNRFIGILLSRLFFDLTIKGDRQVIEKEGVVISCSKRSFINALALVQLFPRIYFVHYRHYTPSTVTTLLYRLFHILPVAYESKQKHPHNAYSPIEKVLKQGYAVCLFQNTKPPRGMDEQSLLNFTTMLEKQTQQEIIPIDIQKNHDNTVGLNVFHFFKMISIHMDITIKDPIKSVEEIKNEKPIAKS